MVFFNAKVIAASSQLNHDRVTYLKFSFQPLPDQIFAEPISRNTLVLKQKITLSKCLYYSSIQPL